jgi:hypothetical protein
LRAQGQLDGIQQGLIINRLSEITECPAFPGLSPSPCIIETGNENYRQFETPLNQFLVKLQTTHPGHPDIGNNTGVLISNLGF